MMGLPAVATAQVYVLSFASALTQAAQRLMPLGQTQGQLVLAALAPLCQSIGQAAVLQTTDDLGTCAFAIDIAAMRHETQEPRMFRS